MRSGTAPDPVQVDILPVGESARKESAHYHARTQVGYNSSTAVVNWVSGTETTVDRNAYYIRARDYVHTGSVHCTDIW